MQCKALALHCISLFMVGSLAGVFIGHEQCVSLCLSLFFDGLSSVTGVAQFSEQIAVNLVAVGADEAV